MILVQCFKILFMLENTNAVFLSEVHAIEHMVLCVLSEWLMILNSAPIVNTSSYLTKIQ